MKKLTVLLLTIILIVSLAGCGSDNTASTTEIEGCEVSLITGADGLENELAVETWECVERYANENELGSEYFISEKDTRESYLATIEKAVNEGAKLVVLAGNNYEITTYEAQSKYKDTKFLLIDGIPHSSKNKYETKSNTIGVMFAEEEAGYLAGYAVVKEGYKDVAFLGTKKTPSIKRYGYGFVQGVAAAAKEDEQKINLKFEYAGSDVASDKVKEKAAQMYKDGTQIIFTAGGSIIESVAEAAEESNGKVIGSDVDRSKISATVITSAIKNVDSAIEDAIDGYADDNYLGGTAFNYAAKNKGIALEMDNVNFAKFTADQYDEVYNKLREGKIELKKDSQIKSVKNIKNKWVTIKE